MQNLDELERKIGYSFSNKALLINALTHSSYANEHAKEHMAHNERLEFLGDACLELVSSDFLFKKYADLAEGELSKFRASLVCEPTLADDAKVLDLSSYLLMGKGEEKTGGRFRASIVSDALEALIGAIYLDGGFEAAKAFVLKFVMNDIENKRLFYDSKTILQEKVQAMKNAVLSYELIEESGPAHDRKYVTVALIDGKEFGRGEGHSKKASEQDAAYRALLKLKN